MYCRFSNADKQDGRSIEQQVLAIREAGAKLDITFPDDCVFADAAIEGWKEDRPALNHLRHLIREGRIKPKTIFVFEVARLSRDTELSIKLQKFFSFHGITVHYVVDGMVSDVKGFKLLHQFKSVVAETFLETLSENVKHGHANQFEKGYFAHAKTYGTTKRTTSIPIMQTTSTTRSTAMASIP